HLCVYAYGTHRDLHSFPTRRSSDLSSSATARASPMTSVAVVLEVGASPSGHASRSTDTSRLTAAWRAIVDPALPVIVISGAPIRDRKSTRLNSSHVKISYAVFCLKK